MQKHTFELFCACEETENSLVLATRGHVSVGLSREKMCIILFTFYIVEHLEEKQYVALALATTESSH